MVDFGLFEALVALVDENLETDDTLIITEHCLQVINNSIVDSNRIKQELLDVE